MPNLILSRRLGETIMVGEAAVTVERIHGDNVRLSIQAPREVPVHRREIWEAIRREKITAGLAAINAK